MKKRMFASVLVLLLLAVCVTVGRGRSAEAQPRLKVVATTYPVYVFACAVTQGVDGVVVERLDTGSVSCLHDYTLSVRDMRKIETADVIALSGAELEEFMEDALATSDAAVIDCSQGVELLESLSHHHDEDDHGHHGHDHGHFDPHYWLDPANAAVMVENLYAGLAPILNEGDEAQQCRAAADGTIAGLDSADELAADLLDGLDREAAGLITFHDGFQYFAHAFGLRLLEAIEEEAGSEASAREIVEITRLVKEHDLPVIFTEVNGSEATANAISRETGCRVAQLSMLMDGPDVDPKEKAPVAYYYDALRENVAAVADAFGGKEGMNEG